MGHQSGYRRLVGIDQIDSSLAAPLRQLALPVSPCKRLRFHLPGLCSGWLKRSPHGARQRANA
jgi:hypothetical protein